MNTRILNIGSAIGEHILDEYSHFPTKRKIATIKFSQLISGRFGQRFCSLQRVLGINNI